MMWEKEKSDWHGFMRGIKRNWKEQVEIIVSRTILVREKNEMVIGGKMGCGKICACFLRWGK